MLGSIEDRQQRDESVKLIKKTALDLQLTLQQLGQIVQGGEDKQLLLEQEAPKNVSVFPDIPMSLRVPVRGLPSPAVF